MLIACYLNSQSDFLNESLPNMVSGMLKTVNSGGL